MSILRTWIEVHSTDPIKQQKQRRITTMKKLLALGMLMFMAGTAFAATPKVACDVKGSVKMVKSAEACKSLGGVVVPATPAKKI